MSIDWITVAAQIANFLVLVWLLRRFLYRPILDGIDAREAEIANRMQDALRAKEQAKAAETQYQDELSALHQQSAELTDAAQRQAEADRDALLAEAHTQLAQERQGWQTHLDAETRKYASRLNQAGAGAVLSLTRKALRDLADETLEERMARHLGHRLASMTDDLQRAAGPVTEAIASSHTALPQAARDELSAQVQTVCPGIPVRFDTDPEQSPGLILRMGGAQLEWTVESYIAGLDAQLQEELAIGLNPKARPDAP